MKRTVDFTRVNSDSNGNGRYACHFLAFIGPNDKFTSLDDRYALALQRAKPLGGRKFHNKQYGGGIVFQAYDSQLEKLSEKIIAIAGEPTFEAMQRRATILVKFHATNGNNDNRYSVTIRDFPKRFYDASTAENAGIHGQDQAEYFAEKRIAELKLSWVIQAAGTLPNGDAIFTV